MAHQNIIHYGELYFVRWHGDISESKIRPVCLKTLDECSNYYVIRNTVMKKAFSQKTSKIDLSDFIVIANI